MAGADGGFDLERYLQRIGVLSTPEPTLGFLAEMARAQLTSIPELPSFPRLAAIVGDRGYRGLAKLAAKRGLALDIKAPNRGVAKFVSIRPLVKVEHAFAQLGRWRRLSRCYEQTEASATAWLEVAAMGYLFARLRVEPA